MTSPMNKLKTPPTFIRLLRFIIRALNSFPNQIGGSRFEIYFSFRDKKNFCILSIEFKSEKPGEIDKDETKKQQKIHKVKKREKCENNKHKKSKNTSRFSHRIQAGFLILVIILLIMLTMASLTIDSLKRHFENLY